MSIQFKFALSTSQQLDPIESVILYHSTNGTVWDPIIVDSIDISTLSIDIDGKYIWVSSLADPTKWSLLKTRSISGAESSTGLIFPPQSLPTTNYGAQKLQSGDSAIYSIGQKIDLMLELDYDDSLIIGNQITVMIKDYFDNIIGQVVAEKIEGTGLYTSEYTIPLNLRDFYNTNLSDESGLDNTLFYLKDIWLFPEGTQIEFSFQAYKVASNQAVLPGQIYEIKIDNINNLKVGKVIKFTSRLDKYYANVDMVLSLFPELNVIDRFNLIRMIMYLSEYVDLHMRPNVLHDEKSYWSAVSCFISNMLVVKALGSDIDLIEEEKQLDTMIIRKKYGKDRKISLLNNADECANIVYAGGEDTVFKSRAFAKGVFDPNRPMLSRGALDLISFPIDAPYVNYSERQIVLQMSNGQNIEVRGKRTLSTKEAEMI